MSKPLDQQLYNFASLIGRLIYKKNSAYRSGYIQKLYKQLGGTYEDIYKEKPLQRWFKEKWVDVSKEEAYPTYRPSKRINKNTPLIIKEIDTKNLKEQIKLKQKLKGEKNLPPFKKKQNKE